MKKLILASLIGLSVWSTLPSHQLSFHAIAPPEVNLSREVEGRARVDPMYDTSDRKWVVSASLQVRR